MKTTPASILNTGTVVGLSETLVIDYISMRATKTNVSHKLLSAGV